MQAEGFNSNFNVNIDEMLDKSFHSYRKHKSLNEDIYFKWNPFNLVNKHYTRNGDQVFEKMIENSIPKMIYQSRPNLVLNIGNEYVTFMLMEELKSKLVSVNLILFYFSYRVL